MNSRMYTCINGGGGIGFCEHAVLSNPAENKYSVGMQGQGGNSNKPVCAKTDTSRAEAIRNMLETFLAFTDDDR